MKKLVLAVVLVALLAAAVFGGQAIASNKPADSKIDEQTDSYIWPWGSPVRTQSFEGCFDHIDYVDGYSGNILEKSYPEVRHVSVTISARDFNVWSSADDRALIVSESCCGISDILDDDDKWGTFNHYETFEFNTDHWYIYLETTVDSQAIYSYAVTVTYPR